jgi:CheY-like chemotaxis protein
MNNNIKFFFYFLNFQDIVLPNLDGNYIILLYFIITSILYINISICHVGVEATTQIRRFDPNTPIISMTSNTTKQECIKYLSHGMNDILAKPFTKANLLSMLERYCMHLKVMPNFQSIPRPLGTADRSIATNNNNFISSDLTDDNLSENWISNPLAIATGDNSYPFTVLSSDDYMQMVNNVVNTSNSMNNNGTRYLEGNDNNQNQRPRKKPKFEEL